jgi:hypothetical protein
MTKPAAHALRRVQQVSRMESFTKVEIANLSKAIVLRFLLCHRSMVLRA